MRISNFYINLDRSEKRREHMEKQAGQCGLTLTRISAVEGSALPAEQLLACQPLSSPKRRLTAGEIGCFLSHRVAWQRIVDGETEYGAVFEDDVLLSPDAGEFLRDDHWLPSNADLVKTETFMQKVMLEFLVSQTPNNRALAKLVYRHYGTGGYIVSRTCAARLLAATEVFHDPIDIAMFSPKSVALRNMSILQLSPAICIQEMCVPQIGDHSDLEGSSLIQARTVAMGRRELRRSSALKSFGKSLESTLRESRQRFSAWRAGGVWGTVEFR